MKRFSLAIAAGLTVVGLVAPGAASAQMVELGQTTSSPIIAPSCPSGVSASQCLIILTRTTAIQSNVNGLLNPTKVKKAGWIVGFTIGLSKLSSSTGARPRPPSPCCAPAPTTSTPSRPRPACTT
jgi:hypothetical protein